MSTCWKTRQFLDLAEYSEDVVRPTEIERHLATCEECRSYGAEMAMLREVLRTQHRITAPPDFSLRVTARLRTIKRIEHRAWFSLIPTSALAGLAVAVVSIAYFNSVRLSPMPSSMPVGSSVAITVNTVATPLPGPVESVAMAAAVSTTVSRASTTPQRRSGRRGPTAQPTDDGGSVLLLLRDAANRERVVSVPGVIYGARSVINSTRPAHEIVSDTQRIF